MQQQVPVVVCRCARGRSTHPGTHSCYGGMRLLLVGVVLTAPAAVPGWEEAGEEHHSHQGSLAQLAVIGEWEWIRTVALLLWFVFAGDGQQEGRRAPLSLGSSAGFGHECARRNQRLPCR